MLRKLGLLALLPISAAVAFGVAFLVFYRGTYDPPVQVDIPIEEITSSRLPAETFSDSPLPQIEGGLLLVDFLHANAFTNNETIALSARVANRGYDVETLGDLDPLPESGRLRLLEEKLRRADSFLVVLPQVAYTEAEAALVERFVKKGGKLLLVSDPGRSHQINSLAASFGLEFRPDYLYNLAEYDLNFRNIIVREFQPDELTIGLDAITLHTTGSVRSSGPGLAFASPGTISSVLESSERLYPIAEGSNRNVLAIADFTFLVPPQNSLLDNDRLISNIADYLTTSERGYDLADFPHFYEAGGDDSIDILLGQPALWNIGSVMKNGLSTYRISSQLREAEDLSRDTMFLGLYEDALSVSRYLESAGVGIDDTLTTPLTPALELEGTSVIVLDRNQDRHVLIVLADTPETLAGAVGNLLDGDFRGSLVTDFVGVGG